MLAREEEKEEEEETEEKILLKTSLPNFSVFDNMAEFSKEIKNSSSKDIILIYILQFRIIKSPFITNWVSRISIKENHYYFVIISS